MKMGEEEEEEEEEEEDHDHDDDDDDLMVCARREKREPMRKSSRLLGKDAPDYVQEKVIATVSGSQ
jgi:hypothetical protein